MKAEPLSKELFDKLKAAQVAEVTLNFMGGSDEANLGVFLRGAMRQEMAELTDLEGEVEEWAWKAYDYSGAGDGSEYGDDIVYDLAKGEVRTQEWSSAPVYEKAQPEKLEVI